MGRFAHVVQLRMTRTELTALQRLAQLQQCSVEELIRNELRLDSIQTAAPPQPSPGR